MSPPRFILNLPREWIYVHRSHCRFCAEIPQIALIENYLLSIQCKSKNFLSFFLKVFFTGDGDELDGRAKFLEEVKTALRTQPMR